MPDTAMMTRDAPETRIDQQIARMEDKFAETLPDHIPPKRFLRVATRAARDQLLSEVVATPDGRRSLFEACLQAATDGLLPDGREGKIVPFRTKVGNQWVDLAQWMPMVGGLMKKARQSGEIAKIVCQCVYANDEFAIDFVAEDKPIHHRLSNMADRGEMVGVYAIARLRSGDWTEPEFLTKAQVDQVRQRSKTGAVGRVDRNGNPIPPKGPWVTDYEEMSRKTAIRRASKRWPSSTDRDEDLMSTIRRDDALTDLDGVERLELTPSPARTKRSAAALLAAEDTDAANSEASPEAADTDHDPATGEVYEDAAYEFEDGEAVRDDETV